LSTIAIPDIRIALVGLGHVAVHQIAAINLTAGIRLVAACDKNPGTAQCLRDGIPFYSRVEDLLAERQADVVMISAPNREHFRLGQMVIDAGTNLVLEKPAVENRQQLNAIVRRREQSGVFLYFAMHAAFGAEVIWLRRQVEEDALRLGELRSFEARFHDPYVTHDVLTEGAASLGGSWMDSGVNALSVLGTFLEPADMRVDASRMRRSPHLDCSETEAIVSLSHRQAHGTIHTSWLTGRNHKSTRLVFEEAEVLLDHSNQQASIGSSVDQKAAFNYSGPLHRLTNHYAGVFSDLVALFSSGRSNVEFAAALHDLYFCADETRQWSLDTTAAKSDLASR